MDKDLLIQNIIKYCISKGEPPTNACFSAGVGRSFIANMRKGQTPSVAKIADLAAYLGVSTSDLVGDNVSNLDTFLFFAPTEGRDHIASLVRPDSWGATSTSRSLRTAAWVPLSALS